MITRIENRTVNNAVWTDLEKCTENKVRKKLQGSGYEEIRTGIFVPEEYAFQYAMERIVQDGDLQKEFKETVVEWFYSNSEWREEK